VKLKVRFFATFREIFRARETDVALTGDATVRDLLERICATPAQRGQVFEGGELKPYIIILKNGRHIQHLDGLATRLEDGDVVSIFPPLAGG